ncbi:class II aldolase/adducin family protein [Enterococcus sp. 669A]|uniref:Class II aldolase/adducin family protein n=1 Tax=Candidatus Enterococcus moelleringii TaxID=2815325 RepID=A0ABS3LF48_9ENTE|nr:class II aldolase/adducin family protein [Enterococcus sp. 669A]MBO1308249.1 class II aldolase/adducin family protein [Enterococcus sp. 669A]
MLYPIERAHLAKIVKNIYDRYGTNAAGGNISVRLNDEHIIMTPTLMSQNHLCDLSPYQILVVDMDENIVEGDGRLTREINMHMACYRENRKIGCVLHGHARESMVFACQGMDMPNLTEATQKFGEIPCLPFAPACSPELAEIVKNHVASLGDDVLSKVMLLNKHGVLVLEENLNKANDMLERLEYNAYIAYKAMIYDKLGISDTENKEYAYNLEE